MQFCTLTLVFATAAVTTAYPYDSYGYDDPAGVVGGYQTPAAFSAYLATKREAYDSYGYDDPAGVVGGYQTPAAFSAYLATKRDAEDDKVTLHSANDQVSTAAVPIVTMEAESVKETKYTSVPTKDPEFFHLPTMLPPHQGPGGPARINHTRISTFQTVITPAPVVASREVEGSETFVGDKRIPPPYLGPGPSRKGTSGAEHLSDLNFLLKQHDIDERNCDVHCVGDLSFKNGGQMCAGHCEESPNHWRCKTQWPPQCFIARKPWENHGGKGGW
ncbi:hypothetical protein LTR97_000023 [Elasticomyces elasticus]|uniref:Uncharacterized protein n=1 Tax=Elasticomyces elasticus TaxID=574655 RepID=A0AAN8A5I2_9PEZI|nr:hypothetical protein LTR97_000023 [Elasticomyces elasticus]